MKLFFAVLATALSSAVAVPRKIASINSGVPADSKLGMELLSKARQLEENGDDDEVDITWVAGYSLKFQGCHHIRQWNADADEDEDVRIETKRLVRFRLCPRGSCSASKAAGCSGGHGDYIIDLNTFMDSYFEATRRATEYECEYYLQNNCDCEDDDGKGDDFDRDYCEYDCYADAGMEESCSDRNPYEDDEGNEEDFDPDRYMECQQYEFPEDDDDGNQRRRLDQDGEEEEQQYYVGPYCGDEGASVFLGLFTDDSCTTFADSDGGASTFETLAGTALPYSAVSLVDSDCVSCLNREQDDQDDDGQDNNEVVLDACENVYEPAGKCEESLPDGMLDYPNNNACNYIEGVRITRHDGLITRGGNRANPVATVFIILFALLTAAMAFYVYYLRMRLGVKQNALL